MNTWDSKQLADLTSWYGVCVISLATLWRFPWLALSSVRSLPTVISSISWSTGPLFPIAINQARRVIPADLLTQSIGWIAAFGAIGGAVVPFITGALAGAAGIETFQPLYVHVVPPDLHSLIHCSLLALMAGVMGMWALVPTKQPASSLNRP
jgi:hypothetical protein